MGIPLFYKHVISQHPDIITESKQKINVKYNFIDKLKKYAIKRLFKKV